MKEFFSLNYWFNIRAGELAPIAQNGLVIFILILAILYIISLILVKKNKSGLYTKSWKKISDFSLTNFIIGIVLLFFTYEMIPFLSARFWFLIWLAGIITWLVFIGKNLAEIPIKSEALKKEREFKKYIPS